MAKSIQHRLKELERQNRLLTENLVDSIWVIDAETMVYEYSAPPVGKLSGYTAAELLGKSIFEELTVASAKKALVLLKSEMMAYERGKHVPRSLELQVVDKAGNTYWVEIRAKFVQEPHQSLKIIGITRDITARKKAEEQQEQLNTKLVEALAEKERLLEEIKVLQKLLPICSGCKRIRDDNGRWWPLDAYVRAHTESDFTHTICSDCKNVFYADKKKHPEAIFSRLRRLH